MWLVIALRFIPTCVGQMTRYGMHAPGDLRFIPTCVGQIAYEDVTRFFPFRFIPTCVGQILPKMKLLLDFYQLKAVEVYDGSARVAVNFHTKPLLIVGGIGN